MNNDNYESVYKTGTYLEKLIFINRNSKVTKGGRVFGFSALTVVGNGNGKVGIGRGKAKEVPIAIQKAMENAKRNLIFITLNGTTIYHKIIIKYCATKIILLPASNGTGIISCSVMRAIFEVIGIKNIFGKCLGSRNPNNIANAVIKGLLDMQRTIDTNAYRKKIS